MTQRDTSLPAGRRSVLYALRRRGDATVEQLAEQLGMTVSGARQHLQALQASGLVESAAAQPAQPMRGRRSLVYSVTPTADSLFPKAYGELTNELLGYLGDTDADRLDELFAMRREHRIASASARLDDLSTLRDQVAELTQILDEDGYIATWEEIEPGTYRIIEHNCAIWVVAQRYGQACTSELDFIRRVLPEATVERVEHMVAGARHCAYEVRARDAASSGLDGRRRAEGSLATPTREDAASSGGGA
jgi:DeoR family transcriptional regulator, suf operon transcriptional repressor